MELTEMRSQLTECEQAWAVKATEFGHSDLSPHGERNLRMDMIGLEMEMERLRRDTRRAIEDARTSYASIQ